VGIKQEQKTSINRLLCISPEASLLEAVQLLVRFRVHRLCITQRALPNTVLCLLEHHRILQSILEHLRTETGVADLTLRQLGVGTFDKKITKVPEDTSVIKILDLMAEQHISAVPIVDDKGVAIDVYSRSDVRFLALDGTFNNLDISVKNALAPHRDERKVPFCYHDDKLLTVLERLISTGKHRLVVVHPTARTLEGIISLSDLFFFFLDGNLNSMARAPVSTPMPTRQISGNAPAPAV